MTDKPITMSFEEFQNYFSKTFDAGSLAAIQTLEHAVDALGGLGDIVEDAEMAFGAVAKILAGLRERLESDDGDEKEAE